MEADKQNENPEQTPEQPTTPASEAPHEEVPADALSRTPEELAEEAAQDAPAETTAAAATPEKKVSRLKQFFRRANI